MTSAQINMDRLPVLDRLVLGKNKHPASDLIKDAEKKACAMEVVAYIAGEPWSDNPECVSPALTSFVISLNDRWDDETRQRLTPFLPRLVGTRDGQDEARRYLALDWLCRVYIPAWLRLVPALVDDADTLADLPTIVDLVTATQVGDAVRAIAPRAHAASVASWAAARATVRATAGAAETAALAAAWAAETAAWAAAEVAARDAAEVAANVASWAAARATARDAWNALAPTVLALQTSALDLLDRMIDPSAVTA